MRILLLGADGRMGHMVAQIAKEQGHVITAGLSLTENRNGPFPIYASFGDISEKVDVMLDFSSPALLPAALDYAVENGLPLVIAATGHGDRDRQLMEQAARDIPLLVSGNMSLGIALMRQLVRKVQRALPGFDIEIVEKHHKMKKDAPSGTALMLFRELQQQNPALHIAPDRTTHPEQRDATEVGIHAVRGGTVVGEHSVAFYGPDEVLEIRHAAHSRAIFAQGAVRACSFVLEAAPGLYTMDDVFSGE